MPAQKMFFNAHPKYNLMLPNTLVSCRWNVLVLLDTLVSSTWHVLVLPDTRVMTPQLREELSTLPVEVSLTHGPTHVLSM